MNDDCVCMVCGSPLDVDEQLEAMRSGEYLCNACMEVELDTFEDIEGEV